MNKYFCCCDPSHGARQRKEEGACGAADAATQTHGSTATRIRAPVGKDTGWDKHKAVRPRVTTVAPGAGGRGVVIHRCAIGLGRAAAGGCGCCVQHDQIGPRIPPTRQVRQRAAQATPAITRPQNADGARAAPAARRRGGPPGRAPATRCRREAYSQLATWRAQWGACNQVQAPYVHHTRPQRCPQHSFMGSAPEGGPGEGRSTGALRAAVFPDARAYDQ